VKHEEYAAHDGLSLAALVKSKQVTPREVLDAAIARADAVNPRLNAIVHRMDEKARKAADGPLPEGPFTGLPFLVKDLDGVLAGEPFTGSSRSLVGYVPALESELFLRYRRAGAVIFGKTNTPEFGIMGVTESELRGPARNPWNPEHTTGGSSGGSGAAVAARIVPIAHAGDGGGSIRIPASACGLFGLKPTRGRLPLGPQCGEGWSGLVVPHVLTRSVRDSAAMLDATHGPDTGAPYVAPAPERPFLEEVTRAPGKLRIAFTKRSLLGSATHADCGAAVDDAAKLLSSLGHDVAETELPVDGPAIAKAYLTIVASCVSQTCVATEKLTGVRARPALFEPTTWFLKQVGDELSGRELEEARVTFHAMARDVAAFFERRCDVYLTATMAYPPVKVGALALKPAERFALGALRAIPSGTVLRKALADLAAGSLEKTPNTQVFNMTGQPAMSVPLHWSAAGLPIGVQLAGRFGDEATLLRLAGQLESTRPWKDRAPKM